MKTRQAARPRRRRPKQNAVISTGAEEERRAERSGEPSLRDSPSGRHGGQTSNFSSGKMARSANVMKLRTAFARRGKVRGFSTALRPLARLRSGRNDSCLGALRAEIAAAAFSRTRTRTITSTISSR